MNECPYWWNCVFPTAPNHWTITEKVILLLILWWITVMSYLPHFRRVGRKRKQWAGRWSGACCRLGSVNYPERGSWLTRGMYQHWRCPVGTPEWSLKYNRQHLVKLLPLDNKQPTHFNNKTQCLLLQTSFTYRWSVQRGTWPVPQRWRRFHYWSRSR